MRCGPEVRSGIRALDRAKVLLAAGLLAEAREFTDRAEQVFAAERLKGRPGRFAAGPGRDRPRRPAVAHGPIRGPAGGPQLCRGRASTRSAGGQGDGGQGRIDRSVLDPAAAPSPGPAMTRSGPRAWSTNWSTPGCTRTPGRSSCWRRRRCWRPATSRAPSRRHGPRPTWVPATARANRARRVPLIATELHTRVVAARLDLARGRRSAGLAHVRRGLDELAAYQAQVRLAGPAVGVRRARRRADPAGSADGAEHPVAGGDPAVAGAFPGREHPALRGSPVRGPRPGHRAEPAPDGLLPGADGAAGRCRGSAAGGDRRPVAAAGPVPVLGGRRDRRGEPAVDADRGAAQAGGARRQGQHRRAVPRQRPVPCPGDHRDELPLPRPRADFGLEYLLQRIIGDLNVLADHRILEPLRRVARVSLRVRTADASPARSSTRSSRTSTTARSSSPRPGRPRSCRGRCCRGWPGGRCRSARR